MGALALLALLTAVLFCVWKRIRGGEARTSGESPFVL